MLDTLLFGKTRAAVFTRELCQPRREFFIQRTGRAAQVRTGRYFARASKVGDRGSHFRASRRQPAIRLREHVVAVVRGTQGPHLQSFGRSRIHPRSAAWP